MRSRSPGVTAKKLRAHACCNLHLKLRSPHLVAATLCITLTVGCRTLCFFYSRLPLSLRCALVKALDAAQCAVYFGGPQPSERCVSTPALDRDRFCASRFWSSSQAVLPHPDSVSRIYPRPRVPSAISVTPAPAACANPDSVLRSRRHQISMEAVSPHPARGATPLYQPAPKRTGVARPVAGLSSQHT
jgi:hypothetical protein